ncbi:MAG: hypothetical protein GY853_16780, partial [PVC group bacterium]|nr:hypothetical protein [PVC group bacterium]
MHNLEHLQQQYIITPADKAAGNFVFICKKYYFQVMGHELGIDYEGTNIHLRGNQVYAVCTTNTEADIILKHKRVTNFFGLKFDEKDKALPLLFAVPKLHKDPYKFR